MPRLRKFIICFSLLILLSEGPTVFPQEENQNNSNLRFSFSLGYDNISEKYYLAHFDTLGIPSESLEALKRTTEGIEEKKASLNIDLGKSFSRVSKFSLDNTLSFSNLYLRDLLKIDMSKEWFFLNNLFELRKRQDNNQESSQQDYVANNLDIGLKTSFSRDFTFKIKNGFELTNYQEKGPYIYDYYLNKTSFDLEKDLASDGFLNFSYQFSKRLVPDSNYIDYDRHIFDFTLDKYFGWEFLLQMENELERKRFKKNQGADNYWDNRFILDLSYEIEEPIKFGFKNEFELLRYDLEDEINFDYIENKFTPGLEYELWDGIKLKGEPEWVIFSPREKLYQDYHYNQLAFGLSLEASKSTKWWVSLEDKIGKRDYRYDENPFYTDYYLNQASLLLDGRLTSHLGFNLMLSIDSEWHKSKENNLTVSLFTSELVYSF